jgi:hypothetical protein
MWISLEKNITSAIIMLAPALCSCAPALYLKTEGAQPAELKGTYTLILYGARYGSDIENIVILAKEGTGYSFEVYAPEFDYRVRKNVPADEALAEAQKFVSFHYAFRRSRLSRILDKEGSPIGYEVRPLYSPLDFGYADVMDITYTLRDRKVTARIRLIRELEKPPFREDAPFPFRFIR